MNDREMRRLGVSRRQLYDAVEHAAMRDLPEQDYEYAEWHLARVGIDYHVEVAGFYYSVPHTLIREQVDTRATARTIEVYHRGRRVAAHARRYGGTRHGTDPDHMPSAHRRYAEWNPERFARQARDIGPHTEGADPGCPGAPPAPGIGLPNLHRHSAPCSAALTADRTEAVSLRAVEVGVLSYDSVTSILRHRLDRPSSPPTADGEPLLHANIRGSGYFH